MKELIEVFRMDEVSKAVRVNIIIKLGEIINHQYASNITEPLVFELVNLLDPKHPQLRGTNFRRLAGQLTIGTTE